MRTALGRWSAPLAVVVLLPVVGLLAALAGELVSDRAVAAELLEAVERGTIQTEERTTTVFDLTVDHHSECVGLTTGLGDGGRGILEVALSSPNLGRCESAVARLLAWDEGDPLIRDGDYLRYWHGHTALTRPIVAVGGVEAVRGVVLALLVAAMVVFALTLRARVGTGAALLFMTPLVIGTDLLITPWGGPHGVAAIVMFGSAALLLAGLGGSPSLPATAALAVLSAGLLVLVDVFTFGTMSWALTTSMVAVAWWTSGSRGAELIRPMATGASAWAVGYASTWFAKWALAGFVVGFGDVWDRISAQVATRTLGEVDYIELGLGNTTAVALGSWLRWPIGLALTVVIGGWLAYGITRAVRSGGGVTFAVLASPALLVVVWFEIMQNHTQVHRWFTAPRGVAIAAAAVLLAAHLAGEKEPTESAETVSVET